MPEVSGASDLLVLGPLVRHVDETSATVWVETAASGTVTVTAGEHSASARTFAVHDHHYALVDVVGLTPGSRTAYAVLVDGEHAWPPPDSDFPPSIIATLDHARPLAMAFGSCRTSVGHDKAGNELHGIDALHAYALRLAGVTPSDRIDDPDPDAEMWFPDLLLFLGDQVYADETTAPMKEFIEARRDIEQPPWTELKDYEEYAHLYLLAWSGPAIRWLLSTVPTAMIFDDHDIRDDWNTSRAWKDEMEATSWWHGRIVAGLGSYWVHQHLGNLSPAERAEDELWRRVTSYDGSGELDLTAEVDAFADRADQEPTSYRWSYALDLGPQARLVVVDTRAARVLEEGSRSILDDEELAWLDEQLRGDVDHLLVGSSLPFLLAPGLHHVEAFSEALAGGGWGRRLSKVGERLRTTVDLEHWAAFQRGFQDVAAMLLSVSRGERGRAPGTITILSGDVHHSYVSEAWANDGANDGADDGAGDGAHHRPQQSRILQAVCSPIRNPLSRRWRFATAVLSYGVAGPLGHLVAQSAKVPEAPMHWSLIRGPWFDNNLATLEVRGRGLRLWWATGTVEDDDHERPLLTLAADVDIDAP